MEQSKSTERLNIFKIESNETINDLNDTLGKLKNFDPLYESFENSAELYRNKIYKIYLDLEEQGIDFWSDEFVLRDAILSHLRNKVLEGVFLSKMLAFKIIVSRSQVTNRISNKKAKQIELIINKLEQTNNYIRKYSINASILETLTEYFENNPEKIKSTAGLLEKYNKMKENVNESCPMKLSQIEDNYIKSKIINKRKYRTR